MELQFQKREGKCLKPLIREIKQTELIQELRLSDGMPDVGRILGLWGQPMIRSKQWSGDQIMVSGGVMTWVLYAPEDGSECRSVELWVPFQMRWDIPNSEADGVIRAKPVLRFVDGRTVSSRKMMIRLGLSLHLEALCPMNYPVYEPGELPEDVHILSRNYPVCLAVASGEKIFTMDEEVSVPDETEASKLLRYTVRPEITEKKAMSDKVIFRGNLNLHLLYRDTEGKIHSLEEELPFSQFEQMEEALPEDAIVNIDVIVTGLELDVLDQRLHLKCSMAAQYLAEAKTMVTLVQDAYGIHRDVDVQEESLYLPVILEQRLDTISAEQNLSGKKGEILDVVFMGDLPRQHMTNGEAEQCFSGVFHVLYRGEDGGVQSSAVRWENQRDFPLGENCTADGQIVGQGKIRASDTGDGINLSVPLQIQTRTGIDQELKMITAMELGQVREPDNGRPSLILCRPGKESLWSIAKRCGSTVGAIQKANKMEGEVTENRILLIPVS